jgi:outer membrane biosynthesis protein TonB
MLDSFLKVACTNEEKTAEQARLVEKMRQLPEEYLQKLASGEEKLAFGFDKCDGDWLSRFKGTPLFEQAIELEKQDLQEQMAEQARWREDDLLRSQRNASRDELSVQRKMLELQLAEAEVGGGGEEELQPEASEPLPQEPSVQEPPVSIPVEEPAEEAAGQPQPVQQPAQNNKPTVDVKVAAAHMRSSLALQNLVGKEDPMKTAEERFLKHAIGLGMLAKGVGAAGKSILGAGTQAAKATKGFGGSGAQAAKMGLGAAKGQAGKVLPTVGRAAKSYVKSNPMQAAGIAGAAGLGTGYALG